MKRLLLDYAVAVGSYVSLLALGLVITLTVSTAVGYLPYSDRPGPGWTEPFFSFELVGFYLSWSVLLLLPTAIYGTVIFAWVRLLNLLAAPLVIIRIVSGMTAGLLAYVLVAGVGWYIAIAAFPVLVAAGLGATWGIVVLPRNLGQRSFSHRGWVGWTLISVVMLAGVGGFYWMFLAPRYGQQLDLRIVGVTPGEQRLMTERWTSDLTPLEAALLDSVLPKGRIHGVLTGSSFGGSDLNKARMLIVITTPLTAEARLREPKGVAVVYLQRGDRWEMFPPDAPTVKRSVRLGPGPKPNEVAVTWSSESHPTTYTWAPN